MGIPICRRDYDLMRSSSEALLFKTIQSAHFSQAYRYSTRWCLTVEAKYYNQLELPGFVKFTELKKKKKSAQNCIYLNSLSIWLGTLMYLLIHFIQSCGSSTAYKLMQI